MNMPQRSGGEPVQKKSQQSQGRQHGTSYEYLYLEDAICKRDEAVDFYAVVTTVQKPRPTRGTDLMCAMTVDDTRSSNIQLLFYAPDEDLLPRVQRAGDIIRVHGAKMNQTATLVVKIMPSWSLGSFCLFHGFHGVEAVGDPHLPYHTSSKTLAFDPRLDGALLKVLRGWLATNPIQIQEFAPADYGVRIEGLSNGIFFDLCCQVWHVDTANHVFHVWDGTDAVLSPITVDPAASYQELWASPPSAIPPPPQETLRKLPRFGTVLLVRFEVSSDAVGHSPPPAGSWVRFRNLRCGVRRGELQGVFQKASRMALLAEDAFPVVDLKRRYAERVEAEETKVRWGAAHAGLWQLSPTVTDFDDVPCHTLREALSHQQVPFKFRCLVRVVEVFPPRVADFCVPTAWLPGPTRRPCLGSHVFRLRLTLEDCTGRLHASLAKEDAVGRNRDGRFVRHDISPLPL